MIKDLLKKTLAFGIIATCLVAFNPVRANAEWKHDSTGWWYTEGNSFSIGWRYIDKNWYYFYPNGYMAKSTTINGHYLNDNGAWIDTAVQPQNISVVYPSNWIKAPLTSLDTCYLLDNKGTNVNLVLENMQGLSEEEYNKASDLDVKTNLGVDNIMVKEQEFNNNKSRVTKYYRVYNGVTIETYQVTFINNNIAYIFTIIGRDKISDENMLSFTKMLNSVKFIN